MDRATEAAGSPARLLNRNFLLLWQGQLVSLVGSQAFSLAVMYYAMESTGSATLLGALWGAAKLPGLLLTPLGGAVADRRSRRAILIRCDLVSGAASLLLVGLFALLGSRDPLIVLALFVATVLEEVVLAFFLPALGAALPDLVPEERLTAANSLIQGSSQACVLAGKAAAGALYVWVGAPALFLLDGLSFFYAAGCAALVRLPAPKANVNASRAARGAALVHDLRAAFRFLRASPGLLVLLGIASAAGLFAAPVFVLLPFYVETALGRGAEWYGLLLSAFGAGSVGGLAASGLLGLRSFAALGGWMVAGALAILALGFVQVPWAALLLVMAFGACVSSANVALQTWFQRRTPGELRGRVLALLQTVSTGAGMLGAAAGGVAGDLTGRNIPLVFGFCGTALVLLGLWSGSRRLSAAQSVGASGGQGVLDLPEQFLRKEGLLDETRGSFPE